MLQADHSQVLIEIRLDPGTRTNVGTSLLGATGNGVTNILRSVSILANIGTSLTH